jgi:hypothetical protein
MAHARHRVAALAASAAAAFSFTSTFWRACSAA